MKGRNMEEKVVNKLLSEYPIKEMEDERQRNALVATLLNGEKRMIEFEKNIIPAEFTDLYLVAMHWFAIPGVSEAKNRVELLASYESYQTAKEQYYCEAKQAITSSANDNSVGRVILIGEFHGRKVDFNYKGLPDPNTGVTLASFITKLDTPFVKSYPDIAVGDPNLPVTINQKLYVELDRLLASLKFQQNFLQGGEMNVDVWKNKSSVPLSTKQRANELDDKDDLLAKSKRSTMTTEKWVADPGDMLLPKRPGGRSQGKGIG